MGQYHLTVNIDKRQFIDPHKLGDGLKLLEQANSGAGTMVALHALLACSNGRGGGDYEPHPLIGSWAGDRIAIVGDYADDGDLVARAGDPPAHLIYDLCRWMPGEDQETDDSLSGEQPFRDISDEIAPVVERACGVKFSGDGWRRKDAPQGLAPDLIIRG